MIAATRAVLMLGCLIRVALAQDEADPPRVDSHGFSFESIDAGWKAAPLAESDGAATLSLSHAGRLRASVRAEPAPPGKTAARFAADRLAMVIENGGYREPVAEHGKAGDRELPGLSVRQGDATGADYRVRQFFVLENGMLYTLQEVAPAESSGESEPMFAALWGALRFQAPSDALKQGITLRALAARCGSELGLAADWAEASRRAKEEDKPILVLIRMYAGAGIPDTDVPTAGSWMDEDVVAIVRERFVPIVLDPTMETPLRSPEKYGMGPHSFGNTALVTRPDGTVIADTFLADPFSLFDFLESAPASDRYVNGLIADTTELRRRRDGPAALAALAKRRETCAPDAVASVDTEEGVVLLRMGRMAESATALDRAIDAKPAADVEARALYFRGVVALMQGDRAGGEARWDRLVAEYPDDRWAWFAAANRLSGMYAYGVTANPCWPPEPLLAANRTPAAARVDAKRWREAESGAIEYLLRSQLPSGCWWNPDQLATGSLDAPDPFVEADASICGMALLAHRDSKECAAALEKCLAFVLARQTSWPLDPHPAFFMDYTAWRHAYVLRFLCACLAAKVGDADAIRPEIDGLVARLAMLQQEGGGWTYLLTSLMQGGGAANPDISFVTAAVLLALEDAKEAGASVDEDVLKRGLDCLDAMECDNGAFRYLRLAGEEPEADERLPGAAGRGPLCVHALLRAGRRTLPDLAAAFEAFTAHGRELSREQGKTLMHCGADGQGSHYLFFDYATAAAALRALPEAERPPHRELLLDVVLAGRRADGSFVDNPLLGRACGTGFALIALDALES